MIRGGRRIGRGQLAAIYAAQLLLAFVFLFPVLWVFGISLKTRLQVFTNPPLFFWVPTLQNYANVLRASGFLSALANSAIISVSAVVLSFCVGVPAAYAMARFRSRARTSLYYALLFMRMLPPIAVLLPMYVLFVKLGLGQTRISVVLAYTTFNLPLVVWVMRGFFEDLPFELEESAWIDGATRLRAFVAIVLPIAGPGLVAIGILSLLLAWNDFLFAAVLTGSNTQTLPVLLAGYTTADSGVDWGSLGASAMLVGLPVMLISFLVQRHLVAGLSSGAVKG